MNEDILGLRDTWNQKEGALEFKILARVDLSTYNNFETNSTKITNNSFQN